MIPAFIEPDKTAGKTLRFAVMSTYFLLCRRKLAGRHAEMIALQRAVDKCVSVEIYLCFTKF